jgi:hypothetical protein
LLLRLSLLALAAAQLTLEFVEPDHLLWSKHASNLGSNAGLKSDQFGLGRCQLIGPPVYQGLIVSFVHYGSIQIAARHSHSPPRCDKVLLVASTDIRHPGSLVIGESDHLHQPLLQPLPHLGVCRVGTAGSKPWLTHLRSASLSTSRIS